MFEDEIKTAILALYVQIVLHFDFVFTSMSKFICLIYIQDEFISVIARLLCSIWLIVVPWWALMHICGWIDSRVKTAWQLGYRGTSSAERLHCLLWIFALRLLQFGSSWLVLLTVLAHNLAAKRWLVCALRWESHNLCGLVPAILLGLHWKLRLHASLFLLMADWSKLTQLLQSLLLALVAVVHIIVCRR